MIENVLRGYASASAEWIARSEAISCDQLYAHVADLFPVSPSRVLDIGAGAGRDAAWLASSGHDVTAVEPLAEFRHAGMQLHATSNITWLDDRLPDLRLLPDSAFDCVLLGAVWQHLDDEQRAAAMHRLAELTGSGGVVIMFLRHGPGAPNRPVYQVKPEDTINDALKAGFKLVRKRSAESVQAANRDAGVHWTWLAFAMI
jgi:SAM-dependent methyltransferase